MGTVSYDLLTKPNGDVKGGGSIHLERNCMTPYMCKGSDAILRLHPKPLISLQERMSLASYVSFEKEAAIPTQHLRNI